MVRYSTPIFLLALLLTGCVATGEPFKHGQQVPGQSSLYIYRERAMTGAAFAWDVYLDGEKIAELRTGGYVYLAISPGPHSVLVKVLRGLSLNFSTEPDQAYYLRLGAATTFSEHRFVIQRVPESLALPQLYNMKLQSLPQ